MEEQVRLKGIRKRKDEWGEEKVPREEAREQTLQEELEQGEKPGVQAGTSWVRRRVRVRDLRIKERETP